MLRKTRSLAGQACSKGLRFLLVMTLTLLCSATAWAQDNGDANGNDSFLFTDFSDFKFHKEDLRLTAEHPYIQFYVNIDKPEDKVQITYYRESYYENVDFFQCSQLKKEGAQDKQGNYWYATKQINYKDAKSVEHNLYFKVSYAQQYDNVQYAEVRVYFPKPDPDTESGIHLTTMWNRVQHMQLIEYTVGTLEDGNMNVSDPLPNFMANAEQVGEQTIGISATSNIKAWDLWDVTNNKPVREMTSVEKPSMFVQVNVPQADQTITYRANVQMEVKGYMPEDEKTWTYTQPVEFDVKPFHGIKGLNVTNMVDTKSEQRAHFNRLAWEIDTPLHPDAQDNDQYIIERAFKKDFSDAQTLEAVDIYDFSRFITNEKGDTIRGEYTYDDMDAAAQYNPNELKLERQHVYYRVKRALPSGIWPDKEGVFAAADTLTLDNTLPILKEIKLIQSNDYADDKTVTVRLKLDPFNKVTWDPTTNITLHRFSPEEEHYEGKDYAQKTLTIRGEDVVWSPQDSCFYAEMEDVLNAPFTHYYYHAQYDTATVHYLLPEVRECVSSKEDADACLHEDMAPITSYTATCGTASGLVALAWTIDEGLNDGFRLERSEYGKHQWTEVTLNSPRGTEYLDPTAKAGVVYDYRLTAITKFHGKEYITQETTHGYRPYYGSISGHVSMPDGSSMPGKVSVQLTSERAIEYQEVRDTLDNSIVIMPGVRQEIIDKTVCTDEKGNFAFDDLVYSSDGTMPYKLHVTYSSTSITNPDGSTGAYVVNMGNDNHVVNCNFVVADTYLYSGRVIYAGSTVPVSGVQFLFNDSTLLDAKGAPVMTDQTGRFAFHVPKAQMTLQMHLDGHTFSHGGYLTNEAGETQYIPTEDREYPTLNDSTRMRLTGRIIGGDLQAALPIGRGLSHNNIGDDLTMVIELDGDHTAQFVFNPDDPDNTTRHEKVGETDVTFEKRRVVIKPDVKTGEFTADLYPARYKVTQLYAKGYSTLYHEGEAFDLFEIKHDTTYQRVYHASVNVTCEQLQFGRAKPYFGEEYFNEKNLLDEKVKQTLATYKDKEPQDSTRYTFGYPVFQGDHTYTMRVKAHEDYYYNNEKAGRTPDVVYLKGGKLIVRNGLATGTDEETYTLDDQGSVLFEVFADNNSFNLTGEDALRTLSMQAEINGYYYPAQDIRGFVTGSRKKGTDVMNLGSRLTLLDVLRDPPGQHSYATRQAGTQYRWTYDYTKDFDFVTNIKPTLGAAGKFAIGVGFMNIAEFKAVGNGSITITAARTRTSKSGEYTMTLNEAITTSDDAFDQGAIADVYIGTATNYGLTTTSSFCVIDEPTYKLVKPSIDNGTTKVVKEGQTPDGKNSYLVIGDKVTFVPTSMTTFAYSQRHIVSTILPNLYSRFYDLVLNDRTDAVTKAERTQQSQYWYNEEEDSIYWIRPEGSTKNEVNMADSLLTAIRNWEGIIRQNEEAKVNAMLKKAEKDYSVANSAIDYSEEGSTYYFESTAKLPTVVSGGFGASGEKKPTDKKITTADDGKGKKYNTDNTSTDNTFGGLYFGLDVAFSFNNAETTSKKYIKTTTRGYGFHLDMGSDNSYMEIGVHRAEPSSSDLGMDNTLHENIKEPGEYNKGNARVHNFIFEQKGGASRKPWLPADTTLIYEPGTKLGNNTLKIDNPRIYVDKPVVSNLPQHERAVFRIQLVNETELSAGKYEMYTPSEFVLRLDDASNPNGARIFMDGFPLSGSHTFVLPPGQSIVKTIEVERGAAAYDYENLGLIFQDPCRSLLDTARVSVHYLPTSTPVRISMPADKWVMNTLSPYEVDGNDKKYYIPVSIDGFNINYDNFDHIELQYKLHNEGDDKWTKVCSYYADEKLFATGTGQKELISTSSISNIRFFGEKDPVEAYYDLRAVSFCRLGNGYVTAESAIVSGMKDTRTPRVFGMPQPADGILHYDDVITLKFSENIAYNILDETANFQVRGYVNNTDYDHGTSLRFPGSDNQLAITNVSRNLRKHDFTVEMMLRVDKEAKGSMVLYKHHNELQQNSGDVELRYLADEHRLVGTVGSATATTVDLSTKDISLTSTMMHVGMIHNEEDQTIQFFVGDNIVPLDPSRTEGASTCQSNGRIELGSTLTGNMADVRLWSKALSEYEIANKSGKVLSPTEPGLMAHWMTSETTGNVLTDRVSGADVTLTDVTWATPAGYSMQLPGQQVKLKNAEKFQRNEASDYSLSFWFKVDDLEGDSVTLFNAGGPLFADKGTGKMTIAFENNRLMLHTNGNVIPFGENDFATDRQWHRLTLVANHSHNSGALYIDRQMVAEVDGEHIGGITNASISFGDKGFTGNVDNVSLWRLALPSSFITEYYNLRPTGHESDLLVYLPFERDQRKEDGTLETVFSPYNELAADDTAKPTTAMVDEESVTKDNKSYAPIRSNGGLEALPFTWTATNNELQINIDRTDRQMNHQSVNLVVRGVEDLQGNSLANPQMWSVYYDRNVLVWDDKKITIEADYQQEKTFTAEWNNLSGRQVPFSIDNNASWLAIDKPIGQAQPLDRDAVTFRINEGLSPGHYTTTVYLTDENQLSSPLTIDVTVKAEEPEWEVTKDKRYSQSMNVIARVHIKDINGVEFIDNDRRDVVAVFNKGVCLGKANITYNSTANTSFVFLNVLGMESMNAKAGKGAELLEFRLWNAATGQTLILDANPEVRFAKNSTAGTPEQPIALNENNMMIQDVPLKEGWNWVSFNIKPKTATSSVTELFMDNSVFSVGDVIKPGSGDGFFIKDSLTWRASKGSINIKRDNIYQIYTAKDCNAQVVGYMLEADSCYITLAGSETPQWREMAYLSSVAQPIGRALSDYIIGDKAALGTVVKGHNSFAVATEYGWVGSLTHMYPGQGYYVRHQGKQCNIHFSNIPLGEEKAPKRIAAEREDAVSAENTHYVAAMPVIAQWAEEMETLEGDELVATVAGRVVGRATTTNVPDGRRIIFLTINAQDGDKVTFQQVRDGKTVTRSTARLTFSANGIAGSMEQPLSIGTTNDEDTDGDLYRASGIRYTGGRGIVISNGRKQMK